MLYKPNLEETIQRHCAFWNRQMPDRILCRINVREGDTGAGEETFMDHIPDIEKMYLDFEHWVKAKRKLEDDSFPIVCPNFGVGIVGGYFGAEVTFESGTSWAAPILKDYRDLSKIRYEPDNYWIKKANECLRYYLEKGKEKLAIGMIDTCGPIDAAFILRGSGIMTDFYDHPKKLHRLLDLITEFTIKFVEAQLEIVGQFKGGIFSSWVGWWVPGRPVSITEDEFALCNPSFYSEFGLPYAQRLIDHFRGGWVHLHTLGLHTLPEMVKLKNLMGIQISDDPNSPKAFEKLSWLKDLVGDIPINITCTLEEFLDGLEQRTLPGNVIYDVSAEGYKPLPITVDEANILMERIKEYRS